MLRTPYLDACIGNEKRTRCRRVPLHGRTSGGRVRPVHHQRATRSFRIGPCNYRSCIQPQQGRKRHRTSDQTACKHGEFVAHTLSFVQVNKFIFTPQLR